MINLFGGGVLINEELVEEAVNTATPTATALPTLGEATPISLLNEILIFLSDNLVWIIGILILLIVIYIIYKLLRRKGVKKNEIK